MELTIFIIVSILLFIIFYLIIGGPIHLAIHWLFGGFEKKDDKDDEKNIKSSSATATVIDVNSKDIEVNSYYDESSNLLSLELINKNTQEIVNTYLLQLDPMLGNQTKVTKEIDNGLIKIIQTKTSTGFDLDINLKY